MTEAPQIPHGPLTELQTERFEKAEYDLQRIVWLIGVEGMRGTEERFAYLLQNAADEVMSYRDC